ncbi:TetR/AcrR family transcriptional regulator [Microbacterium sp.]|uniref:TetR/AcrR family transcriptional regulator n=1 Tax=Microbacterium sp. TaxID=51671 RepID=UPI003C74A82F
MSTSPRAYHHGDLRAALLAAAIDSLETGGDFSLRAVARRAGVSAAAPYRHFADREALESAVAVEGLHDLRAALREAVDAVGTDAGVDTDDAVGELQALAVAYVSFALRRPAVFRLMFGRECDTEDTLRVEAAQQVRDLLNGTVTRLFPEADADDAASAQATPLATALWGLAHGLAFLHVDGKLPPHPAAEVDRRVRDAVAAVLTVPRPA